NAVNACKHFCVLRGRLRLLSHHSVTPASLGTTPGGEMRATEENSENSSSVAPLAPRHLTVSKWCTFSNSGKTQAYVDMARPEDPLPSVKIGGKRLIPMPEGAHWLERQARIEPLTTGHSKILRKRDTEAATQRELARERGLHVAQTITKQQS